MYIQYKTILSTCVSITLSSFKKFHLKLKLFPRVFANVAPTYLYLITAVLQYGMFSYTVKVTYWKLKPTSRIMCRLVILQSL